MECIEHNQIKERENEYEYTLNNLEMNDQLNEANNTIVTFKGNEQEFANLAEMLKLHIRVF